MARKFEFCFAPLVLLCSASAFGGAAVRQAVEYPAAGSVAGEIPAAVAVDQRGFTYVAGTRQDDHVVYVAKIDASGKDRIYTAHLGGSGAVWVRGIAVGSLGEVYVAGYTSSADFPVTGGVQATSGGGLDVFVAKLDAKGATWLYSTYLGGSGDDAAEAIAVDPDGNAYVTGWTSSPDFPLRHALAPAKAGGRSAFVAKLKADGSALLYSSYLAGVAGHGIAADRSAVYVAGETGDDGFILRLSADGARQEFSRLLGGTGTGVATDSAGAAYVAGWSESSGAREVFAAKYGIDGSLQYRTVAGPGAGRTPPAIAVDAGGSAYVTGAVEASDSGSHPRLVKLSADGTQQLATSSLDGIAISEALRLAVDPSGTAVVTGTRSTGRPYLGRVATCTYQVGEALKQIPQLGESGTIAVETSPECKWTAASSASWVQVSDTPNADGTLHYTVTSNPGAPRGASISVVGRTILVMQQGTIYRTQAGGFSGPIRTNAGFGTSSLAACDDSCNSGPVALGFSINFYGNPYTQVYVNNNGNVTFGSSNSTFSPLPIPQISSVMIAPFWADVDTRAGAVVTYGQDIVDGHPAFGVNSINVGYYSMHTDKLDSFQVVLIGRSDLGAGFFDIEMNYSSIQWETGDASGGSGGLGGTSVRVGFTNGTNTTGTYFELPGSGVNGAFLDGGPNSLIANSVNSSIPGRYIYPVRAGTIVCATGVTPAAAGVGNNGGQLVVHVTASNQTCTWGVTGLPSWITIVSPGGGNGTGTADLTLQVAAYTGTIRQATIVVATQNYTVTQGGPDLSIAKRHSGGFQPGDTGKNYTITVTNAGGSPTTGTATVTDALPTGLAATAIAGSGWSCTLGTLTCTRTDALNALASYPPITLTVSVASNAPGMVINSATVAGGGSVTSNNKTANDPTGIGPPDLTITKSHSGSFHPGDTADTYTIVVTNSGGSTTTGTVTVTDQLPSGMTATGMSGLGWTCTLSSKTCTRTDALAAAASYPPITLTVSVSSTAPSSVTNTATVSGGGEGNTSNDSANDQTTITGTGVPAFTIAKTHTGNFRQGDVGDTYTITVTNSGAVATSGTVTLTDALPIGMNATVISGNGWSCTLSNLTCTRGDSLLPAASYPAITLTVNVAANAPSALTNSASVTGGGTSGTATVNDPTTILGPGGPGCATSFAGQWNFPAYGGATFTLGTDGFITGYFVGPVTHGIVSGNVLSLYYGGTNGGYPARFQVSPDGMTIVGVPNQFTSGVLGPWVGTRSTQYTPAVACNTNNGAALWIGDWFTTPFGRIAGYMNLNGSVTLWVPPSCTFAGGTFIGTPSGNTLAGTYSSPGGGGGTFTVSIPTTDVANFTGSYTPAGGAGATFSGSRQPPGTISNGQMTLGMEWEGGGYTNGASYGFHGRWNTPFGIVTLKVNFNDRTVTGSYPNGGVITGTVSAAGPFSGPSFPDDGVTLTGTYADALGSSGTIAWKMLGGYFQGTTTSSGGTTSYWAAGRSFSWAGTWAATVTSYGSGGGAVTQGNFVIAKTNSTILNNGSTGQYGQASNQIAQFSNINFLGGLWTDLGESSGCCFDPIFTSSTPWPGTAPGSATTTGYGWLNKGASVLDGNPLAFWGNFNGVNQVTATWTSDSIAGLNFCPATPSPFTGTFSTPLGTMTVTGTGSTLTGTIPNGPTFTGTVTGNTWTGTYTGPNGPGTFTFTNNGNGFTGSYTPTNGTPIGLSGTPTTEPVVNNLVATIPPSLPVIIDGVNQSSPQTVTWTAGTSHTIAAGQPSPSNGTQYVFSYWTDGGASSHTVIAPSTPVNYTAVYGTEYYLTVTAGTGGSVSPASGYYNSGTTVQIAAVPAAGYAFTGWTGSGSGSYTGTANPAVLTTNSPIAETANFAPFVVQYSLTTNVSPAGAGAVTVSPTSANGMYNAGSVVQITAAANSGYLFAGWLGDLSGLTNPQNLTMNGAHTVTATFVASNTTGLGFIPMNSCRIVDTRAGSGKSGAFGAPSLGAGGSRDFPILSGNCNIPANVRAYSMTITAVPSSGALGYLTAWPAGQAQPLVSTLNATDGSPTANQAILPAGTNGSISVFVSNPADVIIDINGYFIPPGGGAMAFYPVTPCRIADTRAGQGKTGVYGAPSIPFNQSRDIPVPASGCGIPANAQAFSLNVTALPAAGKLNFVTAWPTGMPMPVASSLNSFLGKVQANAAIVAAGLNGAVSFFVSDTTDLIVDINGYFAPPGGTGALFFNNITPCRVADTRGATGMFGGPSVPFNAERDFPLRQSSCGLPATAQAYSLNMTVVPQGQLIYLTTWPGTPAQLPIVSTLNAFDGRVIANAAIVPAGGTGGIGVFVSNTTDLVIDVNGYFAP
ncbi:MAG TPA: nidogen-like domain-containing protein [Bryobacteraceae bacterium]|nr:nidogen-like domain-containing protein [Bryobacteraceae bacterium]